MRKLQEYLPSGNDEELETALMSLYLRSSKRNLLVEVATLPLFAFIFAVSIAFPEETPIGPFASSVVIQGLMGMLLAAMFGTIALEVLHLRRLQRLTRQYEGVQLSAPTLARSQRLGISVIAIMALLESTGVRLHFGDSLSDDLAASWLQDKANGCNFLVWWTIHAWHGARLAIGGRVVMFPWWR